MHDDMIWERERERAGGAGTEQPRLMFPPSLFLSHGVLFIGTTRQSPLFLGGEEGGKSASNKRGEETTAQRGRGGVNLRYIFIIFSSLLVGRGGESRKSYNFVFLLLSFILERRKKGTKRN